MGTVYKGPRVKMGLYSDYNKGSIDPLTGRMQYLGKVANRTARIASAAAQGQILASHGDVKVVMAGKMQLKGVTEPLELCTVGSSLLMKRPLGRRPSRGLMISREKTYQASK